MADHRAAFARRFNALAIQRPTPPPVYVRPTDEQLAALPPNLRDMALLSRSFHDAAAAVMPRVAAMLSSLLPQPR